jgi:hypothetical protein
MMRIPTMPTAFHADPHVRTALVPTDACAEGAVLHFSWSPHALTPHAVSAAARRLAERVASELVGVPLRVACLMPSGRPVVSVEHGDAACVVSVAHTRRLIAAAACRQAGGVGIDLVPLDAPAEPLDWCRTPADVLDSEPGDRLARLRLWAAKEAAYKAARIDAGFQPRCVRIAAAGPSRFAWSVATQSGAVRGSGAWLPADGHVLAVAMRPRLAAESPAVPATRYIPPTVQEPVFP